MSDVAPTTARSPWSLATIVGSMALALGLSLAMDVFLLTASIEVPIAILVGAFLFNATVLLQAGVGALIELRRPGHRIGRLFLVSGPLYGFLAANWLTADTLRPLLDSGWYSVLNWASSILSWPGVALIVGWLPLLFPDGSLPSPRWRWPAGFVVLVSTISFLALATRPGGAGGTPVSPIGIPGWPPAFQGLVDAIPFELLLLIVIAVASLVARYRQGDRVERLQVRWFGAAVALALAGFVGTVVQLATGNRDGPIVAILVAYLGILLMPVAVGIAVLRYRLYEIDRIISRTIGWAVVTGLLVAVFGGGVVALQALLEGVTQGRTLAVAASTLVAFALFQPIRRRVQAIVDRRFDRARYDGQRLADAFAGHVRDEVDLGRLRLTLVSTTDQAVRPATAGVWLRPGANG